MRTKLRADFACDGGDCVFAGLGPVQRRRWFSAKILIYALLLMLGLKLRFIMCEWTLLYRRLATGPDAAIKATLARAIGIGRKIA